MTREEYRDTQLRSVWAAHTSDECKPWHLEIMRAIEAAAREECAKECDAMAASVGGSVGVGCSMCARALRVRTTGEGRGTDE